MARYKNISQSGIISSLPGTCNGFLVATHSGGTIKLWDGLEGGGIANSTLTSTNPFVPSSHGVSTLTSSGAMVAASHASATLTSGGTNFKDAVAASGTITSDQTNVTAGDTVTVDGRVYTFRTAATMAATTDVLLGSTAAESVVNLCAKLQQGDTTTAVLTSTYVITVTAKTPGTGGNAIVVDEASTHLTWDSDKDALDGGLAAETVTIGTQVYKFRNGPCDDPYEVEIGSTLTLSLRNLKNAINRTLPAVGYNASTPVNTNVVAYSSDGTTLVIKGRVPGTSLNTVATTETCADAAWGGSTLGGAGNTAGVTTTGALITIGTTVYTVVSELSEVWGAAAIPYQVKKGAAEANMLDNLKLAINATASGVGTLFSTGTVAHPYVIATTNTNTTQVIQARTVGNDAYTAAIIALPTTTGAANTAWEDTTFGGGTGDSNPSVSTDAAQFEINGRTYTFVVELSETSGAAAVADQIVAGANVTASWVAAKKAVNGAGIIGTDYSTGTIQNADVYVGTISATQMYFSANDAGTYGNAFTTTENMANTSWTSTVLAGGTGKRSTPLTGVITLPAVTVGPLVYNFPEPYSLKRGLFVATSGTIDATIGFN